MFSTEQCKLRRQNLVHGEQRPKQPIGNVAGASRRGTSEPKPAAIGKVILLLSYCRQQSARYFMCVNKN